MGRTDGGFGSLTMGMVTVLRGKARAWGGLLRVLAVLTMVAPVIWALSTKVPNLVETPISSDRGDRIAVPIELSYVDYPGSNGEHVARMNLYLGNPEVLVRRRAIEILVANYLTNPRLKSAELSVVGTSCQFETPPRADYPNNATLPFMRGKGCAPLHGAPTGQLELTVRFTGPGRVGLWTYRPLGSPSDQNVIYVPDPAWSDLGLKVELRGYYVDRIGRSGYRRADLLAYMWNVSDDSLWIWIATASAVVLLILGALALPNRATRWPVLPASGAGLLLSGGISLLYVVLVPPFQAADEPSHFLGYGYVTGDPQLEPEAAQWAKRGHFERLQFHPNERFRPTDIGRPYMVDWNDVFVVDVTRSSVTVPFWRRIGNRLNNLTVPRRLLTLRLINVAVFSVTIAVCTVMIGLLSTAKRPETAVGMLLLVPTLPFFGTYVSNYAPVVAAYAIVASACLVLFLDGPRAHFAGVPLGLGFAFAVATTRSALPMAILLLIVLLARAALRGRGEREGSLGRTAIFWSGILAGVAAFAWLFTERYAWRMGIELARVSSRATSIASVALAHPWLMAAATLAAVVALEGFCSVVRRACKGRIQRHVVRWIRPTCLLGIAAVVATLVASIFLNLPHLTSARGAGPVTLGTYVRETLATVATPFRLRDPDFLLSTTFWGGFGWVDTILPPFVLALLSVGTAAATIIVLRRLSVSRDVRKFCWLVTSALAFFATVALYAAATFWMSPDLHGRYLIGPYLFALLVAWSPGLCADEGGGRVSLKPNEWVARGMWLLVVVGHASALLTILTRYF